MTNADLDTKVRDSLTDVLRARQRGTLKRWKQAMLELVVQVADPLREMWRARKGCPQYVTDEDWPTHLCDHLIGWMEQSPAEFDLVCEEAVARPSSFTVFAEAIIPEIARRIWGEYHRLTQHPPQPIEGLGGLPKDAETRTRAGAALLPFFKACCGVFLDRLRRFPGKTHLCTVVFLIFLLRILHSSQGTEKKDATYETLLAWFGFPCSVPNMRARLHRFKHSVERYLSEDANGTVGVT